MKRKTGKYEITTTAGETVKAFVPFPLPPEKPALKIDAQLGEMLLAAENDLSRLDLASDLVPSLEWFIYGFVRKEAVITSQLEGTQATLMDLLTFEASNPSDQNPDADVEEICNYIDALGYARSQLQNQKGLPLSMRLLNETHRRLMKGVRGANQQPGKIRRSQNWIGGTRPGNAVYVPPPPNKLSEVLSSFEKYIHAEDKLLPLVRIGLIHAQFEAIHPYLDGNGRIGRLLIALLLEHWNLISQPLLYLSLFFKRHRAEYYNRLNAVRTDGDWEGWIDYFLHGVSTISKEAVDTARALFELVNHDRQRVIASAKSTLIGVRLFEALPKQPIISIASVTNRFETTKPTAIKAVNALVTLGVLEENTGKRRDRIFAYKSYLKLLGEGTELE